MSKPDLIDLRNCLFRDVNISGGDVEIKFTGAKQGNIFIAMKIEDFNSVVSILLRKFADELASRNPS